MYDNGTIVGFVSIKENSDIIFGLDNDKLVVKTNYGRCRLVLNGKKMTSFYTKEFVVTNLSNCDFGYQSVLESGVGSKGYFIIFDGDIKVSNLQNINVSRKLKQWNIQNFINDKFAPLQNFTEEMLNSWKDNISFRSKDIPTDLNLVLENLVFATENGDDNGSENIENNEEPVVSEKKDTTTDIKTKTTVVKREIVDKRKVALSFASFELGGLWHDIDINKNPFENIGIKFVWKPNFLFFYDKFEFGFYLGLYIFPLKFQSPNTWDAFGYINPNSRFVNSDFSFGSDHYPNIGRMVFDIFDDLFNKISVIRYNNDYDFIHVKAGEVNSIDDLTNFTLYDFNPKYHLLYQRKTSFITSFNFGFFNSYIYAEDLLPKGLYGTNFNFMTPSKSFRLKFEGGSFIDTYDLVKFNENEKWSIPFNAFSTLSIDTFNLPSFGLSFFLGGGIFLPFNSEITNYEDIILSGLNFTLGSKIRFKDLLFSIEFVKDSVLSKVGMFDFGYGFNRDKKFSLLYDYLYSTKSRSDTNSYFTDQYFGFRTKMKLDFIKYVILDISLQLGVSIKYPDHFGLDLLNKIYDKSYIKLVIDSRDYWKNFNINFYALWSIDSIIDSAISGNVLKSFVENDILFAGLSISPVIGFELNFLFGLHPSLTSLIFNAEASITIRAVSFYHPKKRSNYKKNL